VLLGVPVDDLTMDETLDLLHDLVEDGRASGRTHQVATVNADFLTNAVREPDVHRILGLAAVCIADGMPILWGARLVGTPLRERVTGADLLPALAGRAAASGHRLYLFGSAPGVAETAAKVLVERFPGLSIVGNSGPMFATVDDMDPAVLDEIRAARPDVLCVALGNPKQERWISRYGAEVGVPVMIGVGGTLDFLSGARRRSPAWLGRLGLEWLHRAVQEPARLGPRYARDFVVLGPRLLRQGLRVRRTPTSAWSAGLLEHDGTAVRATFNGPFDPGRDPGAAAALAAAADQGAAIVVDLGLNAVIDQVTVGSLAALARRAARRGGRLELTGLSRPVRHRLLGDHAGDAIPGLGAAVDGE
jgi:N-acetylglucosaminyldiphosphoundecaprenol N-acetyl-beta-D-mannosaminyltransferase